MVRFLSIITTTCLLGASPGTLVPGPPVEPPPAPVPPFGPLAAPFPPVGPDALVPPPPRVDPHARAAMTINSTPRNAAKPRRRAERRLEKRRRLFGICDPGRDGPEEALMAA